jgi:metallo-beta-lactamase class B
MREDVPAMESGDKGELKYADDFVYPPVKVDRVLRDGDTVKLGDVVLTAYLTPGHTRGATTWVATIVDNGKPLTVVFPDGAGFNPGYRLVSGLRDHVALLGLVNLANTAWGPAFHVAAGLACGLVA